MEQLSRIWQSMTPGQRARLAATLALVAGCTIALTIWAVRPNYALLYSDLSPEDAAAIAEYLRENKVPYRLIAGGTAIEVPQQRVYDLRLKTASKGLLGSGTVGLELFDKATLPGTDFANRINLQRAIQGELSRTIASLSAVSSARVHVVLPEKSLFGEGKPPQASVLVNLRGGSGLSGEQVRGIQMLVARAVEGLKPEEVTVVDQTGHILGGAGGSGVLTLAQLEAKARYETLLKRRLQAMLDALVGTNKSVVEVQADMTFEQEEVNSEQIAPPEGMAAAPLRREYTITETYSGGTTSTGGAVGVASNVFAPGGARGQTGAGNYSHNEQTREYEFSRTTTKTIRPPGKLQRVTVAVLIDEGVAVDPPTVRSAVEAAIGFDSSRGDIVEVRKVPLEAAKIAEEQGKEASKIAAAERRAELIRQVSRFVGGLALAVVLGLFLLSASKQLRGAMLSRSQGEEMTSVSEQGRQSATLTDGTMPALAERGAGGESPQEMQDPSLAMRQKLAQHAEENSRAFAHQLRALIAEGAGGGERSARNLAARASGGGPQPAQ